MPEKEQFIMGLQLDNTWLVFYSLGGFALLLSLMLIQLFVNYRRKRKVNAELARQNKALLEAEVLLQVQNRELATVKDKLEYFVFAVSHDLKESVRSVTSFAQLLQRKLPLEASFDHYSDLIIDNGQRMNKTLDQLLLITELSNHGEVQTEAFCLASLLEEVAGSVLPEEKYPGRRLDIGPLPLVNANLNLVRQLLEGLLENAVSFQEPGRPMEIEVGFIPASGPKGIFFLKDNGPGVEPQYLEWIFQPFKRLNARGKGGSGLGLGICRRIVELHGGEIWGESQAGEGLTIFFSLPIAVPEPQNHTDA